MRKVTSRVVSGFLAPIFIASTVGCTSFFPLYTYAADDKELSDVNRQEELVKEEVEQLVEEIDEVVEVDSVNDEINYNEDDIYSVVEEIGIDELNDYYTSAGMEPKTTDEVAEMFIDGIETISEEVENGNLEILPNGTIVDSDDNLYYVQAGANYRQIKWWGIRIYRSYTNAKKMARKFHNMSDCYDMVAYFSGELGVFTGNAFLCGVWLGSTYMNWWTDKVANSVTYVNNTNKKRGIRLDITWVSYYKVVSQ